MVCWNGMRRRAPIIRGRGAAFSTWRLLLAVVVSLAYHLFGKFNLLIVRGSLIFRSPPDGCADDPRGRPLSLTSKEYTLFDRTQSALHPHARGRPSRLVSRHAHAVQGDR